MGRGSRLASRLDCGLVETLQVETLHVLLLLTAAIAIVIVIVIANSGRLSIASVNALICGGGGGLYCGCS